MFCSCSTLLSCSVVVCVWDQLLVCSIPSLASTNALLGVMSLPQASSCSRDSCPLQGLTSPAALALAAQQLMFYSSPKLQVLSPCCSWPFPMIG